jgi:hypothetical protein
VRVKEYPRWSHNQQHRRGAQHRVNGQRIVRSIDGGSKSKGYQKIDKQRVLNVNNYANKYVNKHNKNKAIRVKQALGDPQKIVVQTKTFKTNKSVSNKQRIVKHSKNQQTQKLSNDYRPNKTAKFDPKHNNNKQPQKYSSIEPKNNNEKRYSATSQNKTNAYRSQSNSNNKSITHRASSNKQNKSRSTKAPRQSKSQRSQSKHQKK